MKSNLFSFEGYFINEFDRLLEEFKALEKSEAKLKSRFKALKADNPSENTDSEQEKGSKKLAGPNKGEAGAGPVDSKTGKGTVLSPKGPFEIEIPATKDKGMISFGFA